MHCYYQNIYLINNNQPKQTINKINNEKINFFNDDCHIINQKGELIKFELYTFQEELLKQFETHKENIINKARQLDISSLLSNYALYKILNNDNYNVVIITPNLQLSKHMKELLYNNYDNMNQIKLITNTIEKFHLDNNSHIHFYYTKHQIEDYIGRNDKIDLLIIDEAISLKHSMAHFIDNSVFNMCERVIIASTNWFYDK